ncbi:thiamine thiazole synthase, chloroplastic-like [Cicer arietinum]|uniref:Thiamine thiazole synthase, chloroplastic-like n=1 Tax=Cicer arietinum TaxID=3827 RepID=A0A1S2XZ72_CICAR|nr:thiamine thiazole synthase, chloroplastic-like [Cicer arietinum]
MFSLVLAVNSNSACVFLRDFAFYGNAECSATPTYISTQIYSTFLPNINNPLSPKSSFFNGRTIATHTSHIIKSTSHNNSSISMSLNTHNLHSFKFKPIEESIVSREISRCYITNMVTYTDVVILGDSSSGLSCAYGLSKNPNIGIAIIEQSVSPGGGAWLDGQLLSAMVVRKPVDLFLDEIEVDYDEREEYVVIKHVALFTSTILSKLLVRSNMKLFNAVAAEDLIVKEGRVGGVVTNWALVSMKHDIQSCMNPHAMEAKVVVSSCGHDGPFGANGLKMLERVGMIDFVRGINSLDMNTSEHAFVRLTKEIVPGMIITGMEVAEMYGTPRVGLIFGAMMISGQKTAHLALMTLEKNNAIN